MPTSTLQANVQATIERVLYALSSGSSCWITDESGDSRLIGECVMSTLRSTGVRTITVDLAGITADELPSLLLQSFGMVSDQSNSLADWRRLAEFVQGCRSSEQPIAFLWNASFTSSDVIPALQRVLQMCRQVAVHLLVGGEDDGWARLAKHHSLRTDGTLT